MQKCEESPRCWELGTPKPPVARWPPVLAVCQKAIDLRIDLRGGGRSQPASVSNTGTAARLQGREPSKLFRPLCFSKSKDRVCLQR